MKFWRPLALILGFLLAWYGGLHQGKSKQPAMSVEGPGITKAVDVDASPLALVFFDIQDPRIIKDYHNEDDRDLCTSIVFKAKILNLTDKIRHLSADFHIKNADGITLARESTVYVLDPSGGSIEPRVLESFSYGGNHYACEDIKSIELRYSSFVDNKPVSIELPIYDSE